MNLQKRKKKLHILGLVTYRWYFITKTWSLHQGCIPCELLAPDIFLGLASTTVSIDWASHGIKGTCSKVTISLMFLQFLKGLLAVSSNAATYSALYTAHLWSCVPAKCDSKMYPHTMFVMHTKITRTLLKVAFNTPLGSADMASESSHMYSSSWPFT